MSMKLHGAFIFSSIAAFNEIVQDCQASWQKKRQLTHLQTNNFMNRFRNLIISHHHFAIVVIGSTMTAQRQPYKHTLQPIDSMTDSLKQKFILLIIKQAHALHTEDIVNNLCQGTRQNRFKHIGMQAYQLY